MNRNLLLHAFNIEKKGGDYYLPYSHWIYVSEMLKHFDKIIILAGCKKLAQHENSQNVLIKDLTKIEVYELPVSASGTYISSIRFFLCYVRAYKNIKGMTTYYSRYPTPFGWLQKIFAPSDAKRIIHYVGDPIDAAKNNPNFSRLKKNLLIKGFFLEDKLYCWACKGAQVFTNGFHLAEKLSSKSIESTPLVSSTLIEDDFCFSKKNVTQNNARFIYLGYLRTAKGVETVLRAFAIYNKKFPGSTLKIIGSGEFELNLKEIVSKQGINNVSFLGRIENRKEINSHLRSSDVFLFASFSEGSPRVVLEAMANGLAVISTPVGSLPYQFEDEKDILFTDFGNEESMCEKMEFITSNENIYENIREKSFSKVRGLTIDNFFKKIFCDKK